MRNTLSGLGLVFALLCAGTVSAQTSMAPTPAPGQVALGADALVWWFNESPTPVPLVTDGIIGQPGTTTYLGGGSVDTGANPGLRINAAYGLDATTSLEGNIFYIPSRSTGSSVASSGNFGSIDLVIPQIDATTGQESGSELSLAPVYAGSATQQFSNNLLGAELNGVWAMGPASAWRLDLIGGLRFLRLRESLTLTTESPYIPPFPQDIWQTSDTFDTTNHFYGGQIGVRARMAQDAWFVDATAKLALGAMVQKLDIGGSLLTNDFTDFGQTLSYSGGYFALPTNIGSYSRTQFAVVPEIALSLGYRITPAVAVTLGYSYLYASNVVRPGNQINRTINYSQSVAYTEDPTAQLAGPAQPSFQFNDSSFWAQGINVGLSVRF